MWRSGKLPALFVLIVAFTTTQCNRHNVSKSGLDSGKAVGITLTSTSIIICAVTPGTTKLIPACNANFSNEPCSSPDGSFHLQTGQTVQFGVLAYDGISCMVTQ